MARFEPELLQKLLKANQPGSPDYFDGLKEGQSRGKRKSWPRGSK
jgi:hypothetical protein